jgi:hypothetical protein
VSAKRGCTVDGVRYESLTDAAAFLDTCPGAFASSCRYRGSDVFAFKGHAISLDPSKQEGRIIIERPRRHTVEIRTRRPGSALLEYGYVTHRLGAYRGQPV